MLGVYFSHPPGFEHFQLLFPGLGRSGEHEGLDPGRIMRSPTTWIKGESNVEENGKFGK